MSKEMEAKVALDGKSSKLKETSGTVLKALRTNKEHPLEGEKKNRRKEQREVSNDAKLSGLQRGGRNGKRKTPTRPKRAEKGIKSDETEERLRGKMKSHLKW